MSQIKTKLIGGLTTAIVLLFFQSAHADLGSAIKIKKMFVTQSTGMDAIGTGSSGTYVHGKHKSEGSKSKTYPKKGHSYSPHKKSEGSGSKSYSHGKRQHGYKSGYGKSHGHKKASTHGTVSYTHLTLPTKRIV